MLGELAHCFGSKSPLLRFAAIQFSMCDVVVTEDRHQFARGRACFGEHFAERLSQPMEGMTPRESGTLSPILHSHAKRLRAERPVILSHYDIFATPRRRLQRLRQFRVHWNPKRLSRLTLNDVTGRDLKIVPLDCGNVRTAMPKIPRDCIDGARSRTERPSFLECC